LTLCAVRGLLRARLFALVLLTDRSVVNTQNFRTACRLLRPRCLTFRATRRLLRSWLFPPCASHGLLRVRPLTLRDGLRIAPHADTLRPSCCAWIAPCSTLQAPRRSQIALCSTLGGSFRPRISPRSSLCALCWPRMPPCSTLWSFASCPSYTVPDPYHSAPYPDCSVYDTWLLFVSCGLLRILHLVPGVGRGLLRAQHLVLRAGTFW